MAHLLTGHVKRDGQLLGQLRLHVEADAVKCLALLNKVVADIQVGMLVNLAHGNVQHPCLELAELLELVRLLPGGVLQLELLNSVGLRFADILP